MKSLFHVLTVALALGACSTPEQIAFESRRASHGLTLTGSCEAAETCGGSSEGSCWCDDQCVSFGDCCTDAAEVCGVDECDPARGDGCPEGERCVDGPPADCQPEDACGAQDARSEGMCMAFWGYAWDGERCVGLSGCGCEGDDCAALPMELEACEAAYATCDCRDAADPAVHHVTQDPSVCQVIRYTCAPGQEMFSDACGCGCVDPEPAPTCASNADCGEDAFCAFTDTCGEGDGVGECVTRPQACTHHYDPVCGCDDRTYGNACMAANSGVNVAAPGACPPAADSCEDQCGDASRDGSCYCDDWCEAFGDCCADIGAWCD